MTDDNTPDYGIVTYGDWAFEPDGLVPILDENEQCIDALHFHRLTVIRDGNEVEYLRDHDLTPVDDDDDDVDPNEL